MTHLQVCIKLLKDTLGCELFFLQKVPLQKMAYIANCLSFTLATINILIILDVIRLQARKVMGTVMMRDKDLILFFCSFHILFCIKLLKF